MGNCITAKGGYESPALGTYAWGLALEAMAGLLCFLVSNSSYGFEQILKFQPHESIPNRGVAMQALGAIHLCFVAAVGSLLFLGFFISSCFMCPLCIISILQSVWCVITTIVLGIYWNKANETRAQYFEVDNSEINPSAFLARSVSFDSFDTDAGIMLAAAVLSLCCVVPFSRADSIDSDTPPPEAMLYVPTATLLQAGATLCLVGAPQASEILNFGIAWQVVSVVLCIVINISNSACCPKIFNVVVGAAFAGVVFLGIITTIYSGTWYAYGRFIRSGQSLFSLDVEPPTLYTAFRSYIYMNLGTGLVALYIISIAMAVLAAVAAIYALRSILCCCGKTGPKAEEVVKKEEESPA